MLLIKDINGNEELVTNIKGLERTRQVNGEKTLAFLVVPDESNEHSFGMIDTESIIAFEGEEYIIKQVNEQSNGHKSIKQVEAIHRFFVDMLNCIQLKVHNGSITFANVLEFVFKNTPYSYTIVDPFFAERFENFGRENCLSLFQKILSRYGAEFYVEGYQVYLQREIGQKRDFQYRYGYNTKTLNKEISTKNLATIIRGYGGTPDDEGNYPIEKEYISPNVEKFGEIYADPVVNENLSTVEGMQNHLQKVLIDEPQLSITIDIAEIGEEANEGDYGFVIYEPMNVDIEARVVELKETYDYNLKLIHTAVTLSNLRENATDTMVRIQMTNKTLGELTTPDGDLTLQRRRLMANTNVFMDHLGLHLVNPDDSSKRAFHGSGGSAYFGGMIYIEREDGYAWVEDGIAKFDFNVQTTNPSFTHVDVEARNSWFRTHSTNYVSCDRYRFAHKSRYLKIDISQYVNSGGVCSVAIVDTKTGGILAERSSTNDELYSEEGTYGGTITIDLGVPSNDDLERRDFYFQIKTSDPTKEARCRFNGVWLEG
ncbi:phage tail protein [Halalkalibacter flavus]|uniref:phage tail protein n=1 Tax=Halalkalibacter flavus TaxID=3090668 RepID=UPI002FC8B9A4